MGNRRAVPGNDGPPLDPIFGSGSKIAALTAQFWAEFSRVLCERSLRRRHHCGLRRQSRLAAAAVSVMSPRGEFRDVRVRDFLPDHKIRERTISHYHWGIVHSIDAQSRLKVEPARVRRFSFLERTISRFVTCPP